MRLSLVAAAVASLLVSGCGSSPATTFLALTPVPPVSTSNYSGPPIRVPFLRVPVILDRPEFVRQVANTIVISDFDRWAAPLGRLARDTLVQDLQARLPAGKVLPPDAGAGSPEVRIEVTVLSFTASGAEATMSVSYRIVPSPTGTIKSAEPPPTPASLQVPLESEDAASQAKAWSALLGKLSDRIARDLITG